MDKVFNPWNEMERNELRDYLKISLKRDFVDENPLIFTEMFFDKYEYNHRESFLRLCEYAEQYKKNVDGDKMIYLSMSY
jgi:hypothetical protein